LALEPFPGDFGILKSVLLQNPAWPVAKPGEKVYDGYAVVPFLTPFCQLQ
jgi:hypothetical protein